MDDAAPTSSAPTNDGVTETTLGPLLVLSSVLLLGWSAFAILVRPHIPTQPGPLETLLSVGARAVFWLVPCALYLQRYWGRRWYQPLGLGFPLGRPQILVTLALTLAVTVLFFAGTSYRYDVPVDALLRRVTQPARFDLTAPLFEELVFRGLILGELINWVRDSSTSPSQLRLRFWGALLLSSAMFTLIHWPWWLSQLGVVATLERSGPIFFTGLVLGLVFAHTRSLWACVFLHWLNNTVSMTG